MNVRAKRLQADYEQIKQGLRNHPAIRVRGVSGTPPDRYRIEFHVRSLTERVDGTVTERSEHVAEIYLTLAYPKQAPQCRMLTPVFHPNIAPHAICVGDHWAAGESLLSLIIRIGEMLAYQSYNIKSPLNGGAARWVEQNQDLVPTDPRDLSPQAWADAERETPGERQCQNCHADGKPLRTCSRGHRVCPDCLLTCARCGKTYCLLCKLESCAECGRLVCDACRSTCPQCERTVCTAHMEPCSMCGRPGCPDCSIECSQCGRKVCLTHVRQCTVCRGALCVEHAYTCAGCQRALCAQHVQKCEICDRVVCPDCTFKCHQCGTQVCAEHAAQCASCQRVVCPEHRHTCSRCDRPFCEAHFDAETGTCLECRAGEGRVLQPPPDLVFQCASCQANLRVARELIGKQVKCPKCGAISTAL